MDQHTQACATGATDQALTPWTMCMPALLVLQLHRRLPQCTVQCTVTCACQHSADCWPAPSGTRA
jgi:hypothetical protein